MPLVATLSLKSFQVELCSKEEGDEAVCRCLLSTWVEVEEEGATMDEITYILTGLKLEHLIEGVL
jgi:hypothetical protein